MVDIDGWKNHRNIFLYLYGQFTTTKSVYQRVWPKHRKKALTYWVMLKQGKIKVKLVHFFPSQQKGWWRTLLISNRASCWLQLPGSSEPVVWIMSCPQWEWQQKCGETDGLTKAELWEFKLILYSPAGTKANVQINGRWSSDLRLLVLAIA